VISVIRYTVFVVCLNKLVKKNSGQSSISTRNILGMKHEFHLFEKIII
jgi:hypothetical protein